MRKLIATLLMMTFPSFAHAQVKVDGVWATAEACKALLDVQSGKNTFPKNFDSFTYLRNSGTSGWEWGCDFLDRHSNYYGQAVVIASCSSEGDSWPAMFLLESNGKNGWRLISTPESQSQIEEFPTRCIGVK